MPILKLNSKGETIWSSDEGSIQAIADPAQGGEGAKSFDIPIGEIEIEGIEPSSLSFFITSTGETVQVAILKTPGEIEIEGIEPSSLSGANCEIDLLVPGQIDVEGLDDIEVYHYAELSTPGEVKIEGIPGEIFLYAGLKTPGEIEIEGIEPSSLSGANCEIDLLVPGKVDVEGILPSVLTTFNEIDLDTFTLTLSNPGQINVEGLDDIGVYHFAELTSPGEIEVEGIVPDKIGFRNRGIQSIYGGLGEQGSFSLSVPIGIYNLFLLKIGTVLFGNQSISLSLSEGISSIISILNSIDDTILLENGFTGIESIIQEISEGGQNILSVKNTISGDPVQSLLSILGALDEKDILKGYQHLLSSILDPDSVYSSNTSGIYLDGRNISKFVSQCTISRNQSSICNSVSISSNSEELFLISSPFELQGESRIEIHINSDVFYFLLESRSGDAKSFTLSGRDPSAKETETFQEEMEFSLTASTFASVLVADMAQEVVVDWDSSCEDWMVPDTYSFVGYPIDAISSIAREIGAIVRAQDDGSLLVRRKYPVRPVNLPFTEADVSYDRKEMVELKKEETLRKLIDAVTVIKETDVDSFIPRMELEESSPIIGSTVHVRVYWSGNENTTFERYVTDGLVRSLGNFTRTIEDEIISFTNSKASTSYPITELSSVTWYGDEGTISIDEDGNLSIGETSDQLFRICSINYTTTYERLEVSASNVPYLLTVLFLDTLESSGISLDIILSDYAGTSPIYGPDITSNYLYQEDSLKEVGQAYLDDVCYNYADITFQSPYNSESRDGKIIYINDAIIGKRGNYQIIGSDIIIQGPKIANNLTVRSWVVPRV